MNEFDALIPTAVLIPAVWLIWLSVHSLLSPEERTNAMKALTHDPILFILGAGLAVSVIGMLLWIGTQGSLPLGKSVIGVGGFGLAALVWHQTYTSKRS